MGCEQSSSACRAATRGVDVKKATGVVRPAAPPPVRGCTAGERASSRKRTQPASPSETKARESPSHDQKRVKMTRAADNIKIPVFAVAAAVEMPVETRQERLRKRLAAELDALRELVRKAGALSCSSNRRRFLAAEPTLDIAPAAKRMKKSPSPIAEPVVNRSPADKPAENAASVVPMSPAAKGEIVVVVQEEKDEDEEFVNICAGVSPLGNKSLADQSAENATSAPPMSPAEEGEIVVVTEDDKDEEDEFVDICGGVSPLTVRVTTPMDLEATPSSSSDSGSSSSSSDSDSCSSSSSSSDSDSGSDSDECSSSDSDSECESAEPDASVSSPAPLPVAPKKIIKSPADSMMQSTTETEKKPEDNVSIAVLIARAEPEKSRRELREMEEAVRPDVSIHPLELEKLGIRQFDSYTLEKLGLFLKPDV